MQICLVRISPLRLSTVSGSVRGNMASRVNLIIIFCSFGFVSRDTVIGDSHTFLSNTSCYLSYQYCTLMQILLNVAYS